MQRTTVSIQPSDEPARACPYCNEVDLEPATHLEAGRCHPPKFGRPPADLDWSRYPTWVQAWAKRKGYR